MGYVWPIAPDNAAAFIESLPPGNRLDPRNRGVDYMAMIQRCKIDTCECGRKRQAKVCECKGK